MTPINPFNVSEDYCLYKHKTSQLSYLIVLGCTEIPLLINSDDSRVPLFDITYIHAMKAVEKAVNL
jgi:aspartate/glutamate racemase